MKKRYIVVGASIILIVMVWFVTGHVNVDVEMNDVKLKFYHSDNRILRKLTQEDKEKIENIICGYKTREARVPSCGYTDDIALYVNGENDIFCIACDTCFGLYWKNKDIYYALSDEEGEKLHEILKKYGAYFPCI